MGRIRSKHDEFFKNMMRYPEMARDFFETHLSSSVSALIRFSTLKLENVSFVDEKLGKYESDLIFSVKREDTDKEAFLYLLAEHQSSPDALMPFRLIYYMMQFLKLHVIQNEKSPLPLPMIYPMIMYNGSGIWSHDRDFFSLFGDMSELMRKVFFNSSDFIDVGRLDEAGLHTKHLSNLMLASLRRSKNRKELEQKVKLLSDLFLEYGIEGSSDLVYTVLKYNTMIGVESDNEPVSAYWTVFIEGFTPEYREIIVNLEQATRKESFQQGMQQGMQQGVQQGVHETLEAAHYIKEGLDNQSIIEKTGLSIEVIEAFRKIVMH